MTIIGQTALVELLDEIANNCGDNLGRNGEYMSDAVRKASEMAAALTVEYQYGEREA